MTAKEHYDNHLGNFYSWMAGDFTAKQQEQQAFFLAQGIAPKASKIAFDLGSGHGIQTASLANLGFHVIAVDFNHQLLKELRENCRDLVVQIVEDDLIIFLRNTNVKAELIVCMGDTLTHIKNFESVDTLIAEMSKHLLPSGKVVLSFRDLTFELMGLQRFIPVKSDNTRILDCFLEYFEDYVMVHDILHEYSGNAWVQKVSAYPKLRLNSIIVTDLLNKHQLAIIHTEVINQMIYIVAARP
jgi:2-polyprenyl-3-methyl-5-hydroxy-6-metoxy-1,4-benzoquinol methylase